MKEKYMEKTLLQSPINLCWIYRVYMHTCYLYVSLIYSHT